MNVSARWAFGWGPILAWALACTAVAGDDLPARIEQVIDGPQYKQARWGLLAVDAETGQVVYERNADRLFLPASTTKLYSCAAALLAFGPDHQFETVVHRRGDVADGRLRGDLILVASGDLTLGGRTDPSGKMAFADTDHTYANGSTKADLPPGVDPLAGLNELARQVRAAGIRRVDGDVLVDDRLFARSQGSGSGPGLVTPVLVNDNVVDVVITPAEKVGDPAAVRLMPETSFVQADVRVETVEQGKPLRLTLDGEDGRRFTLAGQIPVGHKPQVRILPVEDPSAFARTLLIEALRRQGVAVDASPLLRSRGELPERNGYEKLPRVAAFRSPPLAEALKVTLKVSHNLYASTLPLLVAAKHGKRTLADGLVLQRRYLADLGVDTATVSFAGGAGGANADSVTPRATVQLLRGLAKRPEWPAFRTCLPVLGVDGTLAEAVEKDSPARGKAFAKTGTLSWTDLFNDRPLLRSKALAGVLTTAKGRTLCFAMFVNDVPLPKGVEPSQEGKTLGKLCEILYQHTP